MSEALTTLDSVAAAIIGGFTVHVLDVRRERKATVERLALEIGELIPTALTGMSTTVPLDESTATGTCWWDARNRVMKMLTGLRVQARGFRGAARVRTESDHLLARLGAAHRDLLEGRKTPPHRLIAISSHGLMDAVLGERSDLVRLTT